MKTLLLLFTVTVFQLAAVGSLEAQGKRTSIFNERWLDAVVSIEKGSADNIKPLGTGFLVLDERKRFYLITAAHVILKASQDPKESLHKDLSNLEEALRYRRSDIEGDEAIVTEERLNAFTPHGWIFSARHDLALRVFGFLKTGPTPPGIPVSHFLKKESINTGAPLLVLGFPTGLRSTTHKKPIARRGMVARKGNEGLIVDAFVFPGNSGGPVIYVPPTKFGKGGSIVVNSPFINEEMLVGMITSYIPYEDIAISAQTRKPRILFQENSGLAEVVEAQAISELLKKAELQEDGTGAH